MSLTHSDIDWCSPDNDETKIIFSCGSFPNIPLIGAKGGINYNPALARRQYGYPMKNIPSNIQLEGLFFKNIDDHGNMLKKEIVQAWRLVHSKGRRLLENIFASPWILTFNGYASEHSSSGCHINIKNLFP